MVDQRSILISFLPSFLPSFIRSLAFYSDCVPDSRLSVGFPGSTSGKEPACQCRRHKRQGSIPRSGSSPGGGHSNPLQYSRLENPLDRGAWWATVHGVAKSWHDWSDLSHTHAVRDTLKEFRSYRSFLSEYWVLGRGDKCLSKCL